jgi:hypothetical protein
MNIVINEELKAYIDPLTADEREALERSMLAEGCRDALVLWGEVLVDGHNRYEICSRHGLPFRTVQNPAFQSLEDVQLWMIDQHLGRRSVSDFQRGVLALRKREIVAARKVRVLAGSAQAADAAQPGGSEPPPWEADEEAVPGVPPASAVVAGAGDAAEVSLPPPDPLNTREALARAARLSNSQVVMIEKIQKQAAPEVVAAVRSGTLSISAAAAVASLSAEEQVAAAAGGQEELKQAAKRVRESRRKPREEAPAPEPVDADLLAALRERIAELTAENEALRAEIAQLKATSA